MNDQLREYFVNIFEDLLCAYRTIIVVSLSWSTTGKSYLTKITVLELFSWTCQRHSTAYPMDLLPQSFELTV